VEDCCKQIGYAEVTKGSTFGSSTIHEEWQSMPNSETIPSTFYLSRNDVCANVFNILSILPCPFCHRSFEPF